MRNVEESHETAIEEVNTDLWDTSSDLPDPNGDTPFKVLHQVEEAEMTPQEKTEL